MNKKILIVDSYLMVAEAIAHQFQDADVLIVNNRDEALAAISLKMFDYALIEIMLDDGNGMTLIKPLLMKRVKPIVSSGTASIGNLRACIRLGAYGYINKRLDSRHVLEVLEKVEAGQQAFPGEMIDELRQNPALAIPKLGRSERRILDFYIFHREFTNYEIGDKMALSEGRIRNCMSGLMRKFDVKGRANLAKEADLRGYFPGIGSAMP